MGKIPAFSANLIWIDQVWWKSWNRPAGIRDQSCIGMASPPAAHYTRTRSWLNRLLAPQTRLGGRLAAVGRDDGLQAGRVGEVTGGFARPSCPCENGHDATHSAAPRLRCRIVRESAGDATLPRSFLMAAADRHLLFGLIALQVGLIDQAQLVAAFQAWARDKARPLAEHLTERGGLDADDRIAVEAMVARHLTKRGNDVEKSLASIPAFRSTREGLASIGEPAIEASLTHIGSATTRDDREADQTASYAVGTATGDGLRFRILRPHAQGGLGAVFVALDGELNREVALKQILDKHADDPVSRGRFLLEAEITGGLEHPGIVPVYGLGHLSRRPAVLRDALYRGRHPEGSDRPFPRRKKH